MRPERPCPPAPARSAPDAPPSSFSYIFRITAVAVAVALRPALALPRMIGSLPDYVQSRQHLLYRSHRGIELFRIARADDEIGVRLLVVIEERVAADDGVGMRVGDFAQGTADVAFPGIGAKSPTRIP